MIILLHISFYWSLIGMPKRSAIDGLLSREELDNNVDGSAINNTPELSTNNQDMGRRIRRIRRPMNGILLISIV